jgi:branched-chain amino acid aminotransferase
VASSATRVAKEDHAMSSESLIAYVNGEYVAKDQARISVFDFGFLRGDAVFDTTSAWNGRSSSYRRTSNASSCRSRGAGSRARSPRGAARRDPRDGAARRLQNAYIQTIVTRGEPPLGVRDLTQCRPA